MIRSYNIIFYIFIICILCLNCSNCAIASSKKLLLPRFASIKSNEVNARSGPRLDCPIEWVFIKKGEPIEIYAEFEQWRQIRDMQGDGGWVHVSVLSGKRNVIIIGDKIIPLKKSVSLNSETVVNIAPGFRCQLKKCINDYCQLKCKSFQGWISKRKIWGVYENEIF